MATIGRRAAVVQLRKGLVALLELDVGSAGHLQFGESGVQVESGAATVSAFAGVTSPMVNLTG